MLVDYDDDVPRPREHPWTAEVANEAAKYWDFRARPELISVVLEDFTPWGQYPAVQRFYELLAWLNGPDSIFESNDCGLRPPRRDPEPPEIIKRCFFGDPVVRHARLTIIFRDLAWNAAAPTVNRVKVVIDDGLRDNVPNVPAVVKVGYWAHFFTAIQREGRAVTLRFWAWGEDDVAAMGHLNFTFEAFHECLRWIWDGVKARGST